MRSWSKCVIFSRRTTSFNKAAPRRPALSEFWLSETRTPWLVVKGWPSGSARTRSSEPPAALTPGAAGLPYFSVWFFSAKVLPVASRDGGCTLAPSGGVRALSRPCSACLLGLWGMAAAIFPTAAAFATPSPSFFPPAGSLAGPLSVELKPVAAACAACPGGVDLAICASPEISATVRATVRRVGRHAPCPLLWRRQDTDAMQPTEAPVRSASVGRWLFPLQRLLSKKSLTSRSASSRVLP